MVRRHTQNLREKPSLRLCNRRHHNNTSNIHRDYNLKICSDSKQPSSALTSEPAYCPSCYPSELGFWHSWLVVSLFTIFVDMGLATSGLNSCWHEWIFKGRDESSATFDASERGDGVRGKAVKRAYLLTEAAKRGRNALTTTAVLEPGYFGG